VISVRPDDPEEHKRYLRKLRRRYRKEITGMDQDQLLEIVRDALKLCPSLKIRKPSDVLRFLALRILITPAQSRSRFLVTVIRTILEAVDDWSATKRLNFIYKYVVGRPPPTEEPDFGPWYAEGPILSFPSPLKAQSKPDRLPEF